MNASYAIHKHVIQECFKIRYWSTNRWLLAFPRTNGYRVINNKQE